MAGIYLAYITFVYQVLILNLYFLLDFGNILIICDILQTS